MNILKWMRIVLASVIFVAVTALFLDFTGGVPTDWHWFAHIQLVPALLEGTKIGLTISLIWLVVTLLFGRIYCSAICPFGVMQDVFSRTSKTLRGKKAKFSFRPEMRKTRLTILVVFLIGLFSVPAIVTLLDPYSNFGRILNLLLRPLYLAGNNLLAELLGEVGGVRFRYQAIHVEHAAVFVALTALILAGILSVLFGRRYCNTICPIGTLLGLVSKYSCYKIRLKSDCLSCGLCEKACKSECIDSKNKTVDASRCVACFNCLDTCRRGSLVFTSKQQPERSVNVVPEDKPSLHHCAAFHSGCCSPRRSFMQWSVFSLFLPSLAGLLGTDRVSAQSSSPPADPSLPTGESRIGYEMTHPILPPGAENRTRFQKRCTGCHLCVSKCPANILRPSSTELGLAGFLQPVVKFDYGFCNFDCTICTRVCPSHALVPKEMEEKHRLRIGKVIFLKENCVVHTQDTNCGACAEHCPTGAVHMVPYGDPDQNLTIPEIQAELCVGCGACEHICPVRPYRAIYIDGLPQHEESELGYDPDAKQESVELQDFGF